MESAPGRPSSELTLSCYHRFGGLFSTVKNFELPGPAAPEPLGIWDRKSRKGFHCGDIYFRVLVILGHCHWADLFLTRVVSQPALCLRF